MTSNQFKKLRKDNFLTQKEMAQKLGFSEISVSNWETGKCEVSLRALKKIDELKQKGELK